MTIRLRRFVYKVEAHLRFRTVVLNFSRTGKQRLLSIFSLSFSLSRESDVQGEAGTGSQKKPRLWTIARGDFVFFRKIMKSSTSQKAVAEFSLLGKTDVRENVQRFREINYISLTPTLLLI